MTAQRGITAYETTESSSMWARFREVTRKLGIPRSAALAQAAQMWLESKRAEGVHVAGYARIGEDQ